MTDYIDGDWLHGHINMLANKQTLLIMHLREIAYNEPYQRNINILKARRREITAIQQLLTDIDDAIAVALFTREKEERDKRNEQ